MPPRPLEELYAKVASATSTVLNATPPATGRREIGQFNVFDVADLLLDAPNRPPMTFDRRAFHKISLISGRSRVEYADRAVEVAGRALWVATHRVPYRWLPHDAAQTGHFCVFTEEFLRPAKGAMAADELPIFQPGSCPLWEVTAAQHAAIEAIFKKMLREIASAYAYKYDLLRAYLLELLHEVQRLQPATSPVPAPSAAARLATLFADLLERQFPLETPQQQLRLRTAADYAGQLHVHVNHLNRVLKDSTGLTTTALIGSRVTQEARMLLKQTNWTVSEIAGSLGFADTAHFCNFFKRQTSLTPGDFRG